MPPLVFYLVAFLFCAAVSAQEPQPVSAAAIIAEINLARQNPSKYATLLQRSKAAGRFDGHEANRAADEAIRFLKQAEPRPPLTLSAGLCQAAADHCRAQPTGSIGHGNPAARINRYGTAARGWAENIAYGHRTAREIVLALIVDAGVRGRGHRKNIFNRSYDMAGAAYGPHARLGSVCDIDFASGYIERAAIARAETNSGF
jgi:uncharacterized protein YkwD